MPVGSDQWRAEIACTNVVNVDIFRNDHPCKLVVLVSIIVRGCQLSARRTLSVCKKWLLLKLL